MSLDKKVERLMSLRPDIAIVPECADPATLTRKAPGFRFSDHVWSGSNPNKGLGVFAFNGLTLKRHASCDETYRVFVPVEVHGAVELNILAVWAFDHGVPPKARPNPRTIALALEHYTPFLQSRPSVVAGDFNANPVWDTKRKHKRFAEVNARFRDLGMVSAYHHSTGASFGAEPDATWFQHRKTDKAFHIDYIYLAEVLAARSRPITICLPDEWLSVSDHVPLVLDLEVDSRSS